MFFQLEKTNRMCRQIFHCAKFHRHILIFFYSKGILTQKNGERWWFSPKWENCLLEKHFCLSTSTERWVWQDNQDIQPEGHENTSSSNFSFACSSLEEVQQKFSHVKGWAVKRQAGLWLNTGQDKPTTFWAKLSVVINSRGLFVFGYKGHIFHYSPIHCSE